MASTRSGKSKDSNRRSAARRTSKSNSSSSGSSNQSTSGARSTSTASTSSGSSVTKTESKVAARAALDEGNVDVRQGLERQAKEQEAAQAKALRDGVVSGPEKAAHDQREKIGEENRAALRQPPGVTGEPVGPTGGFVDQTTARPGDALEGHFVQIDLNHKDVAEELRDSGRGYGVYIEPAELDPKTGYPLTAQVRLRDETNALVTVPYEALSPTPYRGR